MREGTAWLSFGADPALSHAERAQGRRESSTAFYSHKNPPGAWDGPPFVSRRPDCECRRLTSDAAPSQKGHSAWASIYTISTQSVRALNLKTNTFCGGGGWLSNGT